MNLDKQRIALAKAHGWRWNEEDRDWYHPVKCEQVSEFHLPDYLNDLNAVHEVETWLFDQYGDEGRRIFGAYLVAICSNCLGQIFHTSDLHYWRSQHATATQRVEAILRTLGLWENDSS